MKQQYYTKGDDIARQRYIKTPIRVSELKFERFYDDLSDTWRLKARRLQARRWRKIKHQLI